jgi:hypothetical protein
VELFCSSVLVCHVLGRTLPLINIFWLCCYEYVICCMVCLILSKVLNHFIA